MCRSRGALNASRSNRAKTPASSARSLSRRFDAREDRAHRPQHGEREEDLGDDDQRERQRSGLAERPGRQRRDGAAGEDRGDHRRPAAPHRAAVRRPSGSADPDGRLRPPRPRAARGLRGDRASGCSSRTASCRARTSAMSAPARAAIARASLPPRGCGPSSAARRASRARRDRGRPHTGDRQPGTARPIRRCPPTRRSHARCPARRTRPRGARVCAHAARGRAIRREPTNTITGAASQPDARTCRPNTSHRTTAPAPSVISRALPSIWCRRSCTASAARRSDETATVFIERRRSAVWHGRYVRGPRAGGATTRRGFRVTIARFLDYLAAVLDRQCDPIAEYACQCCLTRQGASR